MKRILTYFAATLFLGAIVILNGCKEDETDPVITLSSTSTGWDDANKTFTGNIGDTLVLKIDATSNIEMASLKAYFDEATPLVDETTTEATVSGTVTYILEEAHAGMTMSMTVNATSKSGLTTTTAVSVITNEKPTPATKYSAKLLYAPLATDESKTFFSTNDGATYSKKDVEGTTDPVSPKIDFGYYYGATLNASLASPAGFPKSIYDLSSWGTKNNTLLHAQTTVTTADFDAIATAGDFTAAWAKVNMDGADGDAVTLSVGNIVAFTLDAAKGAKKGLIKVKTISGTDGSDGYIEIEVVMEP